MQRTITKFKIVKIQNCLTLGISIATNTVGFKEQMCHWQGLVLFWSTNLGVKSITFIARATVLT